MLPALLILLTTIGGFSYTTTVLSDRTKPVTLAPPDYEATWKEHVDAIQATDSKDARFSLLMRQESIRLQKEFYLGDTRDSTETFETSNSAGSVDVGEDVVAASPDIVSVSMGTSSYFAGMGHPNYEGNKHLVWSRRLNRILTQEDVFAVAPDRALRQLALSVFDNRASLEPLDMSDGLPLDWDHATIGPEGITWSFGPYELGGYLSGGDATISWAVLGPYLRRNLPFVIDAIRKAPAQP